MYSVMVIQSSSTEIGTTFLTLSKSHKRPARGGKITSTKGPT